MGFTRISVGANTQSSTSITNFSSREMKSRAESHEPFSTWPSGGKCTLICAHLDIMIITWARLGTAKNCSTGTKTNARQSTNANATTWCTSCRVTAIHSLTIQSMPRISVSTRNIMKNSSTIQSQQNINQVTTSMYLP